MELVCVIALRWMHFGVSVCAEVLYGCGRGTHLGYGGLIFSAR